LQEFDLSIPEMSVTAELPDFDIKKILGDTERDFSINNEELAIESFQDEVTFKLTYSREDYIEVKQQMNKLMGEKGFTRAEELIKELLFT
jgi:hypothetical protein